MQPVACISSRSCPDWADRFEPVRLSLPVEETAHEDLEMRRGKHRQGCESAACHTVGIARTGNGELEAANRAGHGGLGAPRDAQSG